MFKRGWTTSLNMINYTALNNEHDWGGPIY